MTANQFDALCQKYLIAPSVALEDEEIVKALREKDDAKVEALLQSNF